MNPQPTLEGLLNDMLRYIPTSLKPLLSDDDWASRLKEEYLRMRDLSPADSRKNFLEIVSKLEMFGARFFHLQSVSDPRVAGPAILAISRQGVAFLHRDTHTPLLKYGFNEIVSTRRLGSQSSGKHFIDLKLGNLMVQRTTRCETRQSTEITTIISWYIRAEHLQHSASTLRK
jgi:myosin-15